MAMDAAPAPEGGEDHGETGDHLAPDAEASTSSEPSEQGGQSNGNGEDQHEANRLNPSAAPTRWKKRRSACRASAASTKFRK